MNLGSQRLSHPNFTSPLGVLALPTVEFLDSACVIQFLATTLFPAFKCQNYTYEGKIGTALAKQL